MTKLAREVVDQASQWLGYNEVNGKYKEIIDVYNTLSPLPRGYKAKYTDEWCAIFVTAVAVKTGMTDIIPSECSCPKMLQHFKGIGCWEESDTRRPRVGDIIFYDWGDNGVGDNTGSPDHVGIVAHVNGNDLVVIEGNKHGAVAERLISVNGKYIRGYGVPKYDNPLTNDIETVAREVIRGLWGNALTRKKKLEAAGYDYYQVQSMVNELLRKKPVKSKTVTQLAREVIQGKWGIGETRKKRLTKAGYDYKAVQRKVNELLNK